MAESKLIRSLIWKVINLNTALILLGVEVASFWWTKLLRKFSEPTPTEVLRRNLAESKSYVEYKRFGLELDALTGNDEWKSSPINRHYDHQLIRRRLKHLRELEAAGDLLEMMDFLRSGLLRNLGGLNDPKLYSYCYIGTKALIEEYIGAVNQQFERIGRATQDQLIAQQKLDFIHDSRHSFGTTALVLHGGSTFGLCHIGVVKSLFEHDLLPKVICGTEIGALIAALVCIHTDDELPNFLKPGGIDLEAFAENRGGSAIMRKVERLVKTSHLLDASILERCVRSNTGDITFEEAYRRTNRVLNITVSPTRKNEVPQLLNYLTAPNALIRSAACASAAILGLYDSVDLLIKDESGKVVPWNSSAIRWANGQTSEIDSPLNRLSELFNVNHFVVSQANPYIIPFMSKELQLQDDRLLSRVRNVLYSEIGHRLRQLEQFRLLPRLLRVVVDQKFAGHITLFPSVSLQDFSSLFSRPTPALVDYWIAKGEQATFPILELIRNRCCIEFTLEKVILDLKTENPNRSPHVDSITSLRKTFKRTKSIH